MLKIKPNEYDLLRSFIRNNCGINLGENKAYLIETRLSDLVLEYDCKSYMEFYKKAERNPGLIERVIDAMTTNETFWFRDTTVWTQIEAIIIPYLLEKLKKKLKVRIWFGACSSGQEVYSFLMLLSEYLEKRNLKRQLDKFDFVATDISPSVLFQAKSARYSGIAIQRGLSDYYKNKYFKDNEGIWSFDESLKRRVEFKKLNLQDSIVSLGVFDLVFLRNVLIYFSMDTKKEILDKVASRMEPGSPLILGSTESLRDFSQRFEIVSEKNIIINYLK